LKAAVLENLNNIKVKEVDTPECREDEILLKVEACGICRTDMKCFTMGQRDLKMPRILGHEISGAAVKVGSKVASINKGDRLQVSPGITCGECDYCRQGLDNLCNELKIMGFNYDGGFAQFLLVPSRGVRNGVLNRIPDNISSEEASMTEPLACCINMQESLNLGKGDTVLIFGGGRLGILNAKLARTKGAKKIILIEPHEKRALGPPDGEKYEFDYCINPLKTDALKEVMRITKNKGVDVVITCCPGTEAFYSGLQMVAKRGRFGFFSGLTGNGLSLTDLNLIHYKELCVKGSYGCSIKHNSAALELLASGAIKVKDILGQTIGLDDIEKGLGMVENMAELSVTIVC